MTIFWILAGGLTALALLFVVPPLLTRRAVATGVDQDDLNLTLFREQLAELDRDLAAGNLEQAQYEAARHDLERELLADVDAAQPSGRRWRDGGRWMAIVLAVVIPAGAIGLYLELGEAEIIPRLQAAATQQGSGGAGHAGGDLASMEALVERLAARMAENPQDLAGWLMLGRSYYAIERPDRALEAFEQAYELAPDDPDTLLALAQGIAAVDDGNLSGRPAELIEKVLAIDPDNLGGRWLSGMLAFQQHDYEAAAALWEGVLPQLDPNGDEAIELRQFIAEARRRTDEAGPAAPNTTAVAGAPAEAEPATAMALPETADAQVADARVEVTVRLDEALRAEVGDDDTLFVYAKAAGGPSMPLAVVRARVADLPLTVTLDDSLAMTPEQRLSGAEQVLIGARISKAGEAMPQSGDLEGETGPVAVGADPTPVTVVIDRARP